MNSDFLDIPQGKIASVVTHLEMREKPEVAPHPAPAAELVFHARPELDWYRDLFSRIGADWLWFSRLGLSDAELASVLNDDRVHVYSVRVDGRDEGMLELDFREPGECELGYFGFTPAMVGKGAGRWLMGQAIAKAWAEPITRFHVHTCTLDSPQALPFYLRSGFTAYRRQVEIADDPRQAGILSPDRAPHVPIIPAD
ncbi:GNAT family N-acetyltransferase [Thalassorhabdomicrobium marinisediminis]|uniref:GNAT family N-acetyltransferase n=1 Tax=Thalassorhabdomicrobium marinisediminis TaxID=2170577 RepID=A0A2T7FXV1_9RHOB|nr:GNAT family N-acetyltransferase [Thalassorhabdomicrobium marinisediminis]PVA06994.1 GNAT family N-acetyltransferase [Thalassorhabdomicrobium marinisediminis]